MPKDLFTEDPGEVRTRFLLVQAITSQFWKIWIKLYFPTLIIQQKWHTQKRNLRPGDVCVLQDKSLYRGEWRLAKVTETYEDKNKVVRNVEVMVKPKQEGKGKFQSTKPIHLRRHVSNLIVIVPVDENKDNWDQSEDNDGVNKPKEN